MSGNPVYESPPLCDVDPEHGEMRIEPMYKSIEPEIIIGYGWFCAVPECEGYGGPAPRPKGAKHVKATAEFDAG